MGSSKRPVSPNPPRPSWRSDSTEDPNESEPIRELITPSLRLLPSTPTGLPPLGRSVGEGGGVGGEGGEEEDEGDLQSPLDYPEDFLTLDSPLERVLQLLMEKK